MESEKTTGRLIGALIPVQGAMAYVVNFVLLAPALSVPQGFLANAAKSAFQIRLAVLLGLATGALTLGIAIAAWTVFRRYSRAMALWFVILSLANFSALALENVSILTMLSLSQEYGKGGATELFGAVGLLARWMRYWAHYVNLVIAGGAGLVLYGVLFRFALVPRALAACGLAAVLLQLTAVIRPILGYPIVFLLLAPLGVCHLILAIWLLVRGFEEQEHLAPAEA